MQSILACGLAFWAGGVFTVAISIIDSTGGLTPEGVLQALGWPVSFCFWLIYG